VDKENHLREKIIAELRKHSEGLTIMDLAERLGTSRQTASKYVLALISEGIIKIRKVGPAKLCYLRRMGRKSGR